MDEFHAARPKSVIVPENIEYELDMLYTVK